MTTQPADLDVVIVNCKGLYPVNLTPILFGFAPSPNQDITNAVTMLARMIRFIVADLTDPRSVQQELTFIKPQVMVAICPILLKGQKPWSMFDGLIPNH